MTRTVAIVQTRMSSTRLPGKVLQPILGKPMMQWVVERIRLAEEVDDVVIATTTGDQDDVIVEAAKAMGAGCFRGSEDDVLSRYLQAALEFNADQIIRICSDSPLVDPTVIDETVRYFKSKQPKIDFCCNHIPRVYPLGLDTQIFTLDALKRTDAMAKEAYERSHVTITMYENPDAFRVDNYIPELNYGHLRWTVDTPEDIAFAREVYKRLEHKVDEFSWRDVLAIVEQDPDLSQINAHIEVKASTLG